VLSFEQKVACCCHYLRYFFRTASLEMTPSRLRESARFTTGREANLVDVAKSCLKWKTRIETRQSLPGDD
jgi:hypothetical protein